MKIILKGKKPPYSTPVRIDFFEQIIEIESIKKINQQLKKYGYKIIKIQGRWYGGRYVLSYNEPNLLSLMAIAIAYQFTARYISVYEIR